MNLVTMLGLLAAAGTTFSFIPQVIKTIKTKDTSGISLGMYFILTSGVFLWLIYGLIIKDIPIVAANIITFTLALTVLIMKIKYK